MPQTLQDLPRTTLYFCQGGSDKVYQAAVRQSGDGEDGFVVTFAYGRRGSSLQTGSKTPSPVPLPQAKKIFDALVRAKTAKGYSPGEDGTPFQQTDKAERATGIVPQLCNAITESQLQRLLADDGWWMQEKFDGRRLLIRRHGQQVSGINRRGLLVDALPAPLVAAAGKLAAEDLLLDGELVGDRFIAFDLLSVADQDLRAKAYFKRYEQLLDLVDAVDADELRFAPVAASAKHKLAMLDRLKCANAEGVVFKRFSAVYVPGRPASGGDWLKYKFVATASCIVAGRSSARRSVQLQLHDGAGVVSVGNVTIPANHKIPVTGSIVEVRYLYAYPGGSLYQPVYLGEREDIAADACTTAHLKLKPQDGEGDGGNEDDLTA